MLAILVQVVEEKEIGSRHLGDANTDVGKDGVVVDGEGLEEGFMNPFGDGDRLLFLPHMGKQYRKFIPPQTG